MKFAKIGAYLRQPSSLIAAAIPLLAISDTSGILAKILNDRDGLAAIVHALTTHKDFGPAAIKVASSAVPGGALLAAAATALAQQQIKTADSIEPQKPVAAG